MFPSFTGSARPRRQVNLSGRNNNPFAAVPNSRTSISTPSTQNALVQAHQERILRQQERERPPAATRIQKVWRGYRDRKHARSFWRQEWDKLEGWQAKTVSEATPYHLTLDEARTTQPYSSNEEFLTSLRLLAHFGTWRDEQDVERLYHFALRSSRSTPLQPALYLSNVWRYPILRMAKLCLATLGSQRNSLLPSCMINGFLALLCNLTAAIAEDLGSYSHDYYKTLALIAVNGRSEDKELMVRTAVELLKPVNARIPMIYEGLASELLTVPNLPSIFGNLKGLARWINYNALEGALHDLLFGSSKAILLGLKEKENILWLLAYFIYFRDCVQPEKQKSQGPPGAQYVRIIAKLVSFLANDIGSRIDAPSQEVLGPSASPSNARLSSKPLPNFLRSEILTLISQENVSSLLKNVNLSAGEAEGSPGVNSEASALASYALTLLRAFPRRGDEIRMWLYRGSTSRLSDNARGGKSLPAIKYFYQAASQTGIYQSIHRDPRQTETMLRPETSNKSSTGSSSLPTAESQQQQWRVILLFLELYTFPLKVMDDEEFLSGVRDSSTEWSWTKQSALPLDQVRDLTVFLKNLSFSMYWNATDIAGIEATDARTSLTEYFGGSRVAQNESRPDEPPSKIAEMSVAGVSGMTLAYMKGLVTGVLRMIYERDSRRKFMPKDHWLMTKYFEMDRFITAVVSEEEEKHKIEDSYEDVGDKDASSEDEDDGDDRILVGTQHAQQVRRTARLRRQQQKASRKKYLESVTPRLEILQNTPFFIPFATRVQIFRQFVSLDQLRRRGTADADQWRFAIMNSPMGSEISKHRAKVRRENIFDDAFAQFYELGEGLKEPIQIRFVDKFDTIEEGIDGGGVTKEFLTSVTNEAFGAANGLEALFVENDQNLLYPNPGAVEERKATLQQALYKESSPDWKDNIHDLLRRYEFLGRIVGKCLYEGILVDIHFAPFFLLKWALTGGTGLGARESGYRANLNDLRDLDEGLYQGLLQLKNYPGNVEEDFSLNFTISNNVRISPTETRSVTHELRPNGASISVTNENRLVYISYVARHRLQIEPHHQTSAFLRGLGTIISPSWLSMFNQSELQTLVGGASTEISVSDLQANTQYGGIYSIGDDGMEHPTVQLFWRVMQTFDDTDRKKVLKFVTSTPRAPLLGFGNLNPRFSIRDSGSDQTRLPSTSTCVNLLKLPVYRDEEVLRERLLYSVNSGAGFNLS